MSIEFKNVSKKLGNNIVINDVNIEIKKGEEIIKSNNIFILSKTIPGGILR